MTQHTIVFFSPAGTTRRVAHHLERCLAEHGVTARLVDLGVPAGGPVPADRLGLDRPSCLWIGSPVYCDHALPLVAERELSGRVQQLLEGFLQPVRPTAD